jgi:hypothetical protein
MYMHQITPTATATMRVKNPVVNRALRFLARLRLSTMQVMPAMAIRITAAQS